MKKLVFFPSDPIEAYIKKGRTYSFLEQYYNPGGYFDEVVCLSPWGDEEEKIVSNIRYIKADPCIYKRIIKNIKPDVVRGYGGYRCSDWAAYSKVHGIPTIVSVHDTNPDLIYDSIAYADGIICMSNAVKDAVIRKVGNVTDNIWIMPNRIDTDLFKKNHDVKYIEKLNKIYGERKHILHVGRKVKQKNLDTVIKALKYIDDACVIFIGQGDANIYKEMAKEEGVEKRCFWINRVPNEEMPYWYSWCDCMCTPSRWEGFGYVFVEAAACETPIITSNIGPMNEYLENGENAILVDDYENPIEIAKAIKKCFSNNNDILEMRTNARNVGLKFSKDIVDRQEIEIYKQMIDMGASTKNFYNLKYNMIFKGFLNKSVINRYY